MEREGSSKERQESNEGDRQGKQPLWLPRGSVRAIVFLGLVGAAAWMAISGRELPPWLEEAVALMIGIYFGTRAKG